MELVCAANIFLNTKYPKSIQNQYWSATVQKMLLANSFELNDDAGRQTFAKSGI